MKVRMQARHIISAYGQMKRKRQPIRRLQGSDSFRSLQALQMLGDLPRVIFNKLDTAEVKKNLPTVLD